MMPGQDIGTIQIEFEGNYKFDFGKWCKEKGIKPETINNCPVGIIRMLFPSTFDFVQIQKFFEASSITQKDKFTGAVTEKIELSRYMGDLLYRQQIDAFDVHRVPNNDPPSKLLNIDLRTRDDIYFNFPAGIKMTIIFFILLPNPVRSYVVQTPQIGNYLVNKNCPHCGNKLF